MPAAFPGLPHDNRMLGQPHGNRMSGGWGNRMARPVHLIITMIKRNQTSRLSIKKSLSGGWGNRMPRGAPGLHHFLPREVLLRLQRPDLSSEK